jgi:predicted PurR-regulated permease PerM
LQDDHNDNTPPGGGTAVGVGILTVIASALALSLGRALFLPLAFAFTLNALFRPVVRRLESLRLPAPAGAAAVVLALIALLAAGTFALSHPVRTWVAEAPQTFETAEKKFERLREPIRQVTSAARRIEKATDVTAAPSAAPDTQATRPAQGQGAAQPAEGQTLGPQAVRPEPPAPQGPGFVGRFFGTTTSFVGGLVEVIVLLYLLLASGDLFFRKLLKVMPRRGDKREAAEVVAEAESVVLRYVAVTAAINAGQAVIIALFLWWLGMPNALLWGLFTFVLEFIPYLGATIMIALLSVVAFATLDGSVRVLAAPGVYLLVTTLQNNIVSPILYGDRLKLNPVAVLVGVLLWWFLWGIGGAFLAVPIIATVKIIAEHTDSFHALAEFLGE